MRAVLPSPKRRARPLAGAGVAAFMALAPAAAQNAPVAATGSRAEENAVRQSGDAFGSTIGREVIGIYNQTNVRGFSPVAAGNVRIDGLYFDPVVTPNSRISRTTTIRVGLSALGSPFPAPTGLVDFGFRRPGDEVAASAQVAADAWAPSMLKSTPRCRLVIRSAWGLARRGGWKTALTGRWKDRSAAA